MTHEKESNNLESGQEKPFEDIKNEILEKRAELHSLKRELHSLEQVLLDQYTNENTTDEINKFRERLEITDVYRDHIDSKEEYTETLQLDQEGNILSERLDDNQPPFIFSIGARNVEQVREALYTMQQEHKDLNFCVEESENRDTIKYTVTKNEGE